MAINVTEITLEELLGKIAYNVPMLIQDQTGKELYADDRIWDYPDFETIISQYENYTVFSISISNERKFDGKEPILVIKILKP